MTRQVVCRRVAAVTIAGGGALYAAWFLQWIVPTDLSAVSSYISELSAADQPHHWVFRSSDLIAGIMLIVGSIAALISTQRNRWAVAGWVSLLLFGASTISDSQSPMRCAETASAGCARLGALDELGFRDNLHTFTSAGEDLFFLLTMVCLMVVAWRIGAPSKLRHLATTIAILIVISWVWTTASAAKFELRHINDVLGIAQRTEVTLMGVWLVLVSIALLRARADQTLPVPETIN